jgi:hypothetical protein
MVDYIPIEKARDAGYRGAKRTFARLGHLPPSVAPSLRDAAPRRHA